MRITQASACCPRRAQRTSLVFRCRKDLLKALKLSLRGWKGHLFTCSLVDSKPSGSARRGPALTSSEVRREKERVALAEENAEAPDGLSTVLERDLITSAWTAQLLDLAAMTPRRLEK